MVFWCVRCAAFPPSFTATNAPSPSLFLSLSLSLAAPQICEHFDILIAKTSFAEKFDVIYGSGAASVVLRTFSGVVDNRMSNWLSHGTFTPPVPQPAVALAVPTRVAESPPQGVGERAVR